MLLVSLWSAHGNRAPFIRGRRASSATLEHVPVLDGGGNGMRPVQRCGPCGSSSVQPPARSHPPPPASPVSHLFAVCLKFWFSLFFVRKERNQPPRLTASHHGGRCKRASLLPVAPLTGCKDRSSRNAIGRRFPSRLSAQRSACVRLRPRRLPES